MPFDRLIRLNTIRCWICERVKKAKTFVWATVRTENHSRSENRLKDVGRILEESKKGWSILIRSAPNGSSSQSEPIERSVWWVGPGDGPKPRQPKAQEQILYIRGKHKCLVSSVALHLNWIHNSCGDAWKNAADDASRWHFGGGCSETRRVIHHLCVSLLADEPQSQDSGEWVLLCHLCMEMSNANVGKW